MAKKIAVVGIIRRRHDYDISTGQDVADVRMKADVGEALPARTVVRDNTGKPNMLEMRQVAFENLEQCASFIGCAEGEHVHYSYSTIPYPQEASDD